MTKQFYKFRTASHRHTLVDGTQIRGGQAFIPTEAELRNFADILDPASPPQAINIVTAGGVQEVTFEDEAYTTTAKTIDEVLLDVSDGLVTAAQALEAETSRGDKARKSLVKDLSDLQA